MSVGDFWRAFKANVAMFPGTRRGNVATIFALALVPITVAAGAGVDLGRAMVVRARLASALDAAGLAVGASSGLTAAQMQTLAQSYFSANYTTDSSFGVPASVTVTTGTDTVTLSTSVNMPTTLMNVVGVSTMNVGYTSQVTWGQTKLWVALVLDNTGSMTETDSTGTSKITALKTASTNLLTMLKGAAVNAGDVMVSITPFTTAVNVGTANKAASWLSYTAWDTAGVISPPNGDGDGTYQSQQNCTGNWPNQHCTTTQVWSASNSSHSQWGGCVMDRDQNYDTTNDAPGTVGPPSTYLQAAPPTIYGHASGTTWSLTCPEKMIQLTDVLNSTGYTNLTNEITGMTAGGATNQTIGLQMGWMTLTNSLPFSPGTLPTDTQEYVILLSDGLNTQDRWTGDGSDQDTSTDARMNTLCTNIKAAKVTVYTIYVDLNGTQGNSTVLQNCATDSTKYFDLTTSGQIVTTLNAIGEQITQLRVSK